ncbi:MAG: hypothetical protein JJT96_15995 [Opitutales bacterium]|nr:hypothetical protein [Opitutales bacterium]
MDEIDYEPVLSSKATAALLGLPKVRQSELIAVIRQLAALPTHPGDYREKDHAGREVEYILAGDFVIGFWADNPVRELRIVEVDEV